MKRPLLSVFAASAMVVLADGPAQAELKPTHADVPYGPHARNVVDFWRANGAGPRPLVVFIHGGGWTSGDKRQTDDIILPFLEKGISYAAINYRLTDGAPLPAPVHDAARAIQFLRSKAAEWNINPERIALTGRSAGAASAMWILLHDDLANPASSDPVLRQSTRVSAASVWRGQTALDPKLVSSWVGPQVLDHRMLNTSVGESTMAGALQNYDKHRALWEEFSAYNHIDRNDPPLFMTYDDNITLPSVDPGAGIHHPMLGIKMQEKSDKLGHESHLLIPGHSKSAKYADGDAFLMTILLAP